MAFTSSPTFAAEHGYRYTVSRFMVEGGSYAAPAIEGTRYVEYCDTFAEVKRRLQHHSKALQSKQERFYWVQSPATWFAEAVRNCCFNRRRAFVVAQANYGARSEWLSVVAL